MRRVLDFFRTGPDRPPVSDDLEEVRRIYERRRWSVFLSVTLGYGMFYVGRINLAVVKKPMLDQSLLSATELGYVGTALLGTYAIGKAVNGFLSDRANIARFMSAALLCSAMANLLLGFTSAFWVLLVLWGLNGWFQSVGSAPSVVSLSQWFSRREMGTRYGVWSASHGIGSGLTSYATAALVSWLGWRWGFWGPGLACGISALVMFHTMADRPQTLGLPAVSDFRNDPVPPPRPGASLAKAQLEVLTRPAVWVLGIASALMYVVRYGINSWGMLYFQEARGYTLLSAGAAQSFYFVFTVFGAVACGYISDRFFRSDRNLPALLFGLVNVGSLLGLFLLPPGHVWLDYLLLGSLGFAIGVLVAFLGGLMAVDICREEVAGAAMGMIGGLSYIGAAIQDTTSGILIDAGRTMVEGKVVYDFAPCFWFWIATSVGSVLLTLTVWRARRPGE
ncbi:MAG: MFS transporter [Deltaproteobacteria bacterium]|nr:MFS transporter [Deltaproteobacteria bacterium]